ncbi:MAG: putative Zn-dependent protease [Candidatus Endobugula sp.]|jgi:predicted Zn-dependent protease
MAICGQQNESRQPLQGGAFTVDPARNEYVENIGQRLAALNSESDLSYAIVVLKNDIPNSWALPGGKIWINRGLLVLLDCEAQLAGLGAFAVQARYGRRQALDADFFGINYMVNASYAPQAAVNLSQTIFTSIAK